MQKDKDSLNKRYFSKLFANALGLIIGFFTQTIIPRGLGPKAYGDYSFLTRFFTDVIDFFDTGTSTCFYTRISQRRSEKGLVVFYSYFVVLVMLSVSAFLVFAHLSGGYRAIWPGQQPVYIYLAFLVAIFTWVTQVINLMTDAYGLTVSAETGKVVQRLAGLLSVAALFLLRGLDLLNYFVLNCLLLLLLTAIFLRIVRVYDGMFFRGWSLSVKKIKDYAKEFYTYSHPLFVYSLAGMLTGILDRWILQVFGGSVQQGFFGLSNQIGTVCFLFSSAMTPLIMREFSMAHEKGDIPHMAGLFRRHVPLLYSITAFMACFVAVNSGKVALIMGGDRFRQAGLALMIMAFYPIHRTYGQINGSLFYATGRTRLYRNIGIFFMLIGLPVTYFLIAPKNLFGLDCGAQGLAIKMVALQLLSVNVQLYFNSKVLKISFVKYLAHQLLSVAIMLSAALTVYVFSDHILAGVFRLNVAADFVLSGAAYTAVIFAVAWFFPKIFGLKRDDLMFFKKAMT